MPLLAFCYHKVGTEAEEGRRLNIDPRRLASHVRFFQRRGYEFVKAGDLASRSSGRVACFTFDDGFQSTLDHGVPVFSRLGAPMTIYAVSDRVGEASTWEGEQPRPLAPWDRLLEAQRAGHEIGNHTATHPRLASLSREEQFAEIRRCDEALRSHGLEPGSFCYPYGSLNDESHAVVKEAGYQVGMALGKRLPRLDDPLEAIPRIVVAFGDALPLLLYKLYVRPRLKTH